MSLAIALGATLYVPVQRPNLLALALGGHSDLRSIVVCLEDSLLLQEEQQAKQVFCGLLSRLAVAPPELRIYARPRDPLMLEWMLDQRGIDQISGFVLPKITSANLAEWLGVLGERHFGIMPTIEGMEAFDPAALGLIATGLAPVLDRVHTVRIGGNDILNCLGVRRSRVRTAYDGPLGLAIATMAAAFIPRGLALSAPVFEHYSAPDLLREEVARDVEHGLLTKSAIHPDQVRIIHQALRPAAHEVDEALAILDPAAGAVFGLSGSMCEPTTHRRWAENTLARKRAFGLDEGLGGVDSRVA